MVVNSAKLIHILLVALLLHGHLVTNVHVVGHIHDHDAAHHHDNPTHAAHAHASLSDNAVINFGSHASQQQTEQHKNKADSNKADSNKADNNCSIYHILLTLSGAFCTAQLDIIAPSPDATHPAASITPIANVTTGSQRIRAPPVIS